MQWDPNVYRRYADERSRPFFDLTARIGADAPRTVVDLGCGPGELTATLADRWPDAEIVGIDSSPDMIEAATTKIVGTAPGRIRFELGDIASWHPSETTDVVVSNAALQWVPRHRELLRTWCRELPAGAWLAWQESPRWREKLHGVLRHHDATDPAEGYLRLLQEAGLRVDAWETTYLHVLSGDDPVLQWVRGTGLRPVLDALSPADTAAFEHEYGASLREAYPAGIDGTTVYPFRRVFVVGRIPC